MLELTTVDAVRSLATTSSWKSAVMVASSSAAARVADDQELNLGEANQMSSSASAMRTTWSSIASRRQSSTLVIVIIINPAALQRTRVQRAPRTSWGSVGTNSRLERQPVPAPEVGASFIGRYEELLHGGVWIGGATHHLICQYKLVDIDQSMPRPDERART